MDSESFYPRAAYPNQRFQQKNTQENYPPHYSPHQSAYVPYQITESFPEPTAKYKKPADQELISKEENLLHIDNPDILLKNYMKLRRWEYNFSMQKIGDEYQASIEVVDENIFQQVSRVEAKARIKVIIAVMHYYNSFLTLLWLTKYQDALSSKFLTK